MTALVIIVGAVEAGVFVVLLYLTIAKRRSSLKSAVDEVQHAYEARLVEVTRVEAIVAQLIDIEQLKAKGKDLIQLREALKTERGRVTITQAELETIEGRLRELEEIERELEASGIETKEELNILQKKQKELASKNDQLKSQISASMEQMDLILSQLGENAQVQEQVSMMKRDMIQTEQRIDILLLQIEQGNDQYFILKKRYDALDIEYAQLFEKFSEAEGKGGG